MPAMSPVYAAQYLRMSTEHQQYSLDNQSDAIRRYAEEHGFMVVKTYADAGKSGLKLRNRIALTQLLQDVVGGTREYGAILVYDVSRWGRFQDADEAAHYEFLCKQAGIPVHYCAEQFANDGTISSTLLKALKRSMAAEFSRELGVKTYAGEKRLAELGFWAGGQSGYGLRRMIVGPDGQRKQKLKTHERKSIETDRITLVPGPRCEVEWVRKNFQHGPAKANPPNREAPELSGRKVSGRQAVAL
jgi:DNA invertase Pin-like site-specific DNA recombinase